jgi:hypothetical protein
VLACVQDLSDCALEHLFSKICNTKHPGRVVVFRLGVSGKPEEAEGCVRHDAADDILK